MNQIFGGVNIQINFTYINSIVCNKDSKYLYHRLEMIFRILIPVDIGGQFVQFIGLLSRNKLEEF